MTDLFRLLQLSSGLDCVCLLKGATKPPEIELNVPANVREIPDGEQLALMMPQVLFPFQRDARVLLPAVVTGSS